jgi:sterol desaturase/sphingolipid hydroxylase (fatty acid hydroxylase superfamily)
MLFAFFAMVFVTAAIVGAGLAIEGMAGVRSIRINSVLGVIQIAASLLGNAVVAPALVWIGGTIGNSPVHMSGQGWRFPVSVLIMLALIDFVDYAFHRLEHRIPWLWAMHSLHHSDATMNATTGQRHVWLDRVLHAIVFAPLGFVFHPDLNVMLAVTVGGWVLDTFDHLNIRLGFAWVPWLVVSPQYHRTHHSARPEHFDRNFAGIFPVWDLLFGTYLKPEGFPETGLAEGEPLDIKEALAWAFQAKRASAAVESAP